MEIEKKCVSSDKQVTLGGTGAMCYHTDIIDVAVENFPERNMADVWMAKLAHEQDVPIYVVQHAARYVKHVTFDYRIWKYSTDDTIQTRVLNSFLCGREDSTESNKTL